MPEDRIKQVFTDIQVKTYFSDTDAHIHCTPLSIAQQPKDIIPALSIENTSDNMIIIQLVKQLLDFSLHIPDHQKNSLYQ